MDHEVTNFRVPYGGPGWFAYILFNMAHLSCLNLLELLERDGGRLP